jgi:beta-phosphoglucomutase-like phosphatase (HAD superfamily)
MTNRAIIFDLDGVLVDSKELHYDALNLALKSVNEKYVISRQEQADIFEGMTTRSKLDILSHTKGLPRELHGYIWNLKQQYSAAMFEDTPKDDELINIFKYIFDQGISIGVASNSIRETLTTCLQSLGVWKYVDISLSNEDVSNPKPNPEIYNKCMLMLGSVPTSTIVFEDSVIGRQAARQSGAFLVEVESRKDLTMRFIQDKIVSYFE